MRLEFVAECRVDDRGSDDDPADEIHEEEQRRDGAEAAVERSGRLELGAIVELLGAVAN